MSQENVEIVRRVYEAAARRDSEGILALYDANVEFDASHGPFRTFGHGVYHGHDGLRQVFKEYYDPWEDVEQDFQELIDVGDAVISVGITRARGQTSHVEVEQPIFGVWWVHSGKIVRVAFFPTRRDALEAARLSE